jgi:hypothetical protein
MPQIYQLPLLNVVSGGDQLPIFSPNQGDSRRVSINSLLDYFQKTFASPALATNIFTPGTGFNIAVPNPVAAQQWMLLRPVSTLASGTVTLPLNSQTPDGTEVLITTTQQITAFTLALNGASQAFGVPSILVVGGPFRVRFVQATNSWHRIA